MSTLVTVGFWGWHLSTTWLRYPAAFGIPLLLAICWGTFAVPNDRSRSGKAPIPTSGRIRLLLEVVFFSAGSVALFDLNLFLLGAANTLFVVLHHVLAIERIKWLISNP